jgi:hypothetical protein
VQSALKRDEIFEFESHLGLGVLDVGARVRAFVRQAKFALNPRGDTPERRSIYEALHAGTPVILTSPVAPPLRLPAWPRAVALEASPGGSLRTQPGVVRALEHYYEHVADFERARAPFIWGTREFSAQFGRVVASVFQS